MSSAVTCFSSTEREENNYTYVMSGTNGSSKFSFVGN